MTVAAIIQGRMGSTRLPGKILRSVGGKPLLSYMLERVKHCRSIGRIVVATTTRSEDDRIVRLAREAEVDCYRGSEKDVLDRYYQAALVCRPEVVVRLTADCPLIDPDVVDSIVDLLTEEPDGLDYAATDSTFPDGMDTEVFTLATLKKCWRKATWTSEREHVTPYIAKNPDKFRIRHRSLDPDLGQLRLTVDEESDFQLVAKIFEALYQPDRIFSLSEIVAFLEANPELLELNRHIARNEGYQKSLKEDRIDGRVIGSSD